MGAKKKEQLAQFNRANILEAAKQLFYQKGMVQTTMDDIAKEADCSKSTIYVYFKNKEEIYQYITYEYMEVLKTGIESTLEYYQNKYETCFYEICGLLVEFQVKYPLYFETMMDEIGISQEAFEEAPVLHEIYKIGEQINDLFISYLKKGIAENHIKEELDLRQITFTLWGSIAGVIRMASKKESYIKKEMHLEKEEFLNRSFQMLYGTVGIIS